MGKLTMRHTTDNHDRRPRGLVHRVSAVVLNCAAAVGGLLAIALVVGLSLGLRPVVLISGSMGPTMPTGTLVITQPIAADDIQIGDVLTVTTDEDREITLVTHRVTAVEHHAEGTYVTLRGDANTADDFAPYDVSEGARRTVFYAPGLGAVLTSLQSPIVVLAVAALLLIALLPAKAREHATASGATTHG